MSGLSVSFRCRQNWCLEAEVRSKALYSWTAMSCRLLSVVLLSWEM